MKGKILIVEDEAKMRKIMKINLGVDYTLLLAKDGVEGLKGITENDDLDVVVTDLKMPGMDGMTFLKNIMNSHSNVPVIVITAYGTVENAVEAMKLGAFDYILKPIKIKELKVLIDKAIRHKRILERNEKAKQKAMPLTTSEFITKDERMLLMLNKVDKIAQTDVPVLIEGESGVGKEIIALRIHEKSKRKYGPFVAVNCSAIPQELFESEFFGYEKGAFTGAISSKKGKVEQADGGTLFLDEIGDMPMEQQPKLLRVLQERIVIRVGGTKEIDTDFRLVVATNRQLFSLVQEGKFREDLFYRINVGYIHILPLRERKNDIPLLIEYFISKYSKEFDLSPKNVTDDAMKYLVSYNWFGNVREVQNTVLRMLLDSESDEIGVVSLPPNIIDGTKAASIDYPSFLEEKKKIKDETVGKLEKKFLEELLLSAKGNVSKAAQIARMDRRLLQNMIKKNGIDVSKFKR